MIPALKTALCRAVDHMINGSPETTIVLDRRLDVYRLVIASRAEVLRLLSEEAERITGRKQTIRERTLRPVLGQDQPLLALLVCAPAADRPLQEPVRGFRRTGDVRYDILLTRSNNLNLRKLP